MLSFNQSLHVRPYPGGVEFTLKTWHPDNLTQPSRLYADHTEIVGARELDETHPADLFAALIERMQSEVLTAAVFRVVDDKGFVGCEDMMQLREAGHWIYDLLALKRGVTPKEIQKLTELRKITPDDVRAVLGRL